MSSGRLYSRTRAQGQGLVVACIQLTQWRLQSKLWECLFPIGEISLFMATCSDVCNDFIYLFIDLIWCFPNSSSTPAEDPLKLDECRLAGKYILELLKMDLKPRDIITPMSLRNAMVIVMALGGSTNAVLHLIAIAK